MGAVLPAVLFKITIAPLEGSGVGHFGRPKIWLIAAYSAEVKAKMNGITTVLCRNMKTFTRRLSHGWWYGGSASIHRSLSDDAEAMDGTRECE